MHQSFRDQGYLLQLHSLQPVDCEIDGVARHDALEILGDGDWHSLAEQVPSFVADVWRLRFVATTGHIAVEPDICCLARLPSRSGFVMGHETGERISSAVLGMPGNSLTLARLVDAVNWAVAAIDIPMAERRAAIDQSALTYHLLRTGEAEHAQPIEAFYPVPTRDRMRLVTSSADEEPLSLNGASAIRLWSRRLTKQISAMEDGQPHSGSFLEIMTAKRGIVPSEYPISATETKADRRHVAYLLQRLKPQRSTRVVDVGANPLTPPPYAALAAESGCEVIGFEPHPEAFEELQSKAGPGETYLPYAVGDGNTHELRIARESGLTSVLPAYDGAFTFLGRSRQNMETIDRREMSTVKLDDLSDVEPFDMLKIDIQGGEVMVFEGAAAKLEDATVVITEIRYYQLYEGEPMFGGVDTALRQLGFQLHKIVEEKGKVIPNSQIDRLKRSVNRNQVIDADAVYIRDLGVPDLLNDEQLKHLAILAAGVFESFDLALHCIDLLVKRCAVPESTPAEFASCLPAQYLR